MALNPNVPVVAPLELITSDHLNAIRANLDRLDTTKANLATSVQTTGSTLTGPLEWGGNPAATSPALTIGAGNAGAARLFSSINDATGPSVRLKHITGASSGYLWFDWGAVMIGSVSRLGTNNGVAYNTSSDGRYKHVDADLNPADAATSVRGLRAVIYRWKMSDDEYGGYDENAEPSGPQQVGLIAQEVQPLFPDAVTAPDPAIPQSLWQLDYGRLTPLLIAALQSAFDRLDALEAAT